MTRRVKAALLAALLLFVPLRARAEGLPRGFCYVHEVIGDVILDIRYAGTHNFVGDVIDGKNPTYYYAGQELLEVSVVNIPSNPEALKKALDAQEEELQELRKEAQEPDPKPKPEPDPADEVRAMEIEKQISLTQARVALLN